MLGHVLDLTPISLPQDAVLHHKIASHRPLAVYSQTAFPHHPSPHITPDIVSSAVSCHDRLCQAFKAWGSSDTRVQIN